MIDPESEKDPESETDPETEARQEEAQTTSAGEESVEAVSEGAEHTEAASAPGEAEAASEPETEEEEFEETRPLKQIIEGAILAADQPLTIDQMLGLFEELPPTRVNVREALKAIEEECAERGFELKQVASGYRFQVKTEYGEWVSRLWKEKPPRYTRALLETLALIAYKQPITRGDIEEIRGVAVSTNIMRTLIEREWVRVVGHRDVPGHPALYATTRQFLDYFNLKSLDELPSLAEIKDLTKLNPDLELEEETLIEARTLEINEEDQETVVGLEDADLDEVTDQVNAIQENIQSLFAGPEVADPDALLDDDELDESETAEHTQSADQTPAPDAGEPSAEPPFTDNTPSEDAVNDNDTEENSNRPD